MEQLRILRPMGFLELVDQAFRVYRANFWVFVGIAAGAAPLLWLLNLGLFSTIVPSATRRGHHDVTNWGLLRDRVLSLPARLLAHACRVG